MREVETTEGRRKNLFPGGGVESACEMARTAGLEPDISGFGIQGTTFIPCP